MAVDLVLGIGRDGDGSWVNGHGTRPVADQVALLAGVQPLRGDGVSADLRGTLVAAPMRDGAQQLAHVHRGRVRHARSAAVRGAVVGLAGVVRGHCQRRHEGAQQGHGVPVVHHPGAVEIPIGARETGTLLHLCGGQPHTAIRAGALARRGDIPEAVVGRTAVGEAGQAAHRRAGAAHCPGRIAVDERAAQVAHQAADLLAGRGHRARGVGVDDDAVAVPGEAAHIARARHRTCGVAVEQVAVVLPGQSAHQDACSGHGARGVAVAHDVLVDARQAALVGVARHIARGVAGLDRAAVQAHQAARLVAGRGDRAGGVAVADVAVVVVAHQTAHGFRPHDVARGVAGQDVVGKVVVADQAAHILAGAGHLAQGVIAVRVDTAIGPAHQAAHHAVATHGVGGMAVVHAHGVVGADQPADLVLPAHLAARGVAVVQNAHHGLAQQRAHLGIASHLCVAQAHIANLRPKGLADQALVVG